jgi:hypothetical protein
MMSAPRLPQAVSYFGFSSPFNQPMVLSVFSGSGPSQAKHWAAALSLPPEAKTK